MSKFIYPIRLRSGRVPPLESQNRKPLINTDMSTKETKIDPAADAALSNLAFVAETEYIFSMRSFRMKNGFTFATVLFKDTKLDILIGSATDYKFGELMQAKQFGGNVYATFKHMTTVNGVQYPRFWDVSIG